MIRASARGTLIREGPSTPFDTESGRRPSSTSTSVLTQLPILFIGPTFCKTLLCTYLTLYGLRFIYPSSSRIAVFGDLCVLQRAAMLSNDYIADTSERPFSNISTLRYGSNQVAGIVIPGSQRGSRARPCPPCQLDFSRVERLVLSELGCWRPEGSVHVPGASLVLRRDYLVWLTCTPQSDCSRYLDLIAVIGLHNL